MTCEALEPDFTSHSDKSRQLAVILPHGMDNPSALDRHEPRDDVPVSDEYILGGSDGRSVFNSSITDSVDVSEDPAIKRLADIEPGSSEIVTESVQAVEQASWWRRNKAKIYLGAVAVGVGGTVGGIANGSFENVTHEVIAEAPWAVPALITSEALFIGGIAGMAGGAGRGIGNPLTLRKRKEEVLAAAIDNNAFRAGLAANTLGALGTAGVVVVGAIEALPPETWPGAVGLAALDMASSVAVRAGAYKGMRHVAEKGRTKEVEPTLKVRKARMEDLDRLADIDLYLFEGAYGAERPTKQEVLHMLTRRFINSGESMFVSELDGQVEGFVSTFLTNKSADDFESWEVSTNNGTLDGRVDPNGRYAYVTNMTIMPNASKGGAKEVLLAHLFAYGIEAGVEYGYFESRMPGFSSWLTRQKRKGQEIHLDEETISQVAEDYMNLKRKDGSRYDPQLRMYEKFGFHLDRLVPNAFKDNKSLNYGVICKADVPPAHPLLKKIKPVRHAYAAALRLAAKSPKLLKKVL